MLLKKFCSGLITGLMKDLAGLLNLIESQYINISTHRLLSGSSYIQLPVEFRSSKKGLINIKNNDQKCFYDVMLGILIL